MDQGAGEPAPAKGATTTERRCAVPTLVYFSSVSNNTHRFVEKTGLPARRIPLRPTEEHLRVDEPYVLVVPTYGGGHEGGAVPRQVVTFLNDGANRGLIVLTDRYPQNQTPSFNDGPLLNRVPRAPPWLRRLEACAYLLAQRLPPDLVIKLQVTPETALLREPDMDPSIVRERITTLRHLTFEARHVVTIDAEQPLPDVIRQIKSEIWDLL